MAVTDLYLEERQASELARLRESVDRLAAITAKAVREMGRDGILECEQSIQRLIVNSDKHVGVIGCFARLGLLLATETCLRAKE